MPTIDVDGREYEVPGDKNLLAVLLDLGFNVPYFCWHPAMGSVGACRQCAVKVFHDQSDERGRIVMACMTPVADGMRVSVDDPEAVAFRRRVIEWLMTNHPHDCPVCDEGGECHLQDMTVMAGHVYRRFRGRKRTYRNQHLGPFVNHEMNRCIQCYRCVRFYRDYAGGRDFDVFASKNHVYFGRFEEGALESEFSGNLVEVCPTGVFTDKTLKNHYTRKWDLETAPSICVHCGLGCNITPGARYEMLRRVHARFHPDVNGYFICDRGRYGYEFVNHPHRLRRPQAGRTERRSLSWNAALAEAVAGLKSCRRVVGIGSPRASLEANYALQALVGEQAFSPGLSAADHDGLELALAILRDGPARSASLADVGSADAILVLGTDPTNEAPMLDYAIRQAAHQAAREIAAKLHIPDWNDYAVRDAVQQERGALYLASVAPMKLDEIATESWRLSPPELAALAWAVDRAVRGQTGDEKAPAARIGQAMAAAKQPCVVVSAGGDKELLRAAGNIAYTLSLRREQPCLLSIVVPECNSMGAALLGGRRLTELLDEIQSGGADGLIVLENDLFRRAPAGPVAAALAALHYLVVIDHLPTQTAAAADLLLPAAAFAEAMGTLISAEGRAQRFFQVFVPPAEPRQSWQVVRDLLELLRPGSAPWAITEEVLRALAQADRALAGAQEAAPPASWRDPTGSKIPRMTHRYSGRTAKDADRTVHEPEPPPDPGSPFAFSMEGFQGQPPPDLMSRYWYPAWNSVAALNKFQIEVGGPLRGGAPGKRLIEPGPGASLPFEPAKAPAPLAADEVWVAPRAAIFGSEELSCMGTAVASVIPPLAVRIHPEDAAGRSLAEGARVRLEIVEDADRAAVEIVGAQHAVPVPAGRSAPADKSQPAHRPPVVSLELPLKFDAALARGVAVIPAGYPETAAITATCRARIGRAQ